VAGITEFLPWVAGGAVFWPDLGAAEGAAAAFSGYLGRFPPALPASLYLPGPARGQKSSPFAGGRPGADGVGLFLGEPGRGGRKWHFWKWGYFRRDKGGGIDKWRRNWGDLGWVVSPPASWSREMGCRIRAWNGVFCRRNP